MYILPLLYAAAEARIFSYAPYSDFSVGAAVLTRNNRIYSGTNVENASFGATICAERAAICTALSSGEREFRAIAIVGGSAPLKPCGICRQFLSEFGDMSVICSSASGSYTVTTLSALYPDAFVSFKKGYGYTYG